MTDENTLAIGFQISRIRVDSFTVNDKNVSDDVDIEFGIQIQHVFDADRSEQIVQVELGATAVTGQEPVVVLHAACHYQLTGYQDWLQSQPESQRMPGALPPGLAMTLNSIALSTMRGILFERLRGSHLQNVVLPIIDPSAFQPAN